MADSSIIKEFLVSLGFKIDQAALNKFDGALVQTTKKALAMGATLVGVATAATAFVEHVSTELEDLYWSSVRLRDGVANIRDFQLGLSKMGGTAEGALNALENVAHFIRTQPFAEGLLHNLGVSTRDANGDLRKTIDIVKDFAKLPMPYWLKVRWAERLGIDEGTLQAIIRAAPEAGDKIANMYKAAGLNADEAAKQAHEFKNQLRDTGASIGVIGDVLATAVLPVVTMLAHATEWFAVQLLKADGATKGLSTDLLIIGLIAGGVALAFGWIPALITALGLAAAFVIANWTKVYAFIKPAITWVEGAYNRMATLYNKMAAKTGLPALPLFDTRKKGPQDSDAPTGAPDFKEREKNLGPNSLYGANGGNPNAGRADSALTGKALAFFEKAGWTADQAAGIVANLVHESGLNANAVGDNGQARGIAQWHADRQAAFQQWTGHSLQNSTLDEQLAFVNHELTRGAEAFAGKMLQGAHGAADSAMRVAKYYERPKDLLGAMRDRGATADALAGSGARMAGNTRLQSGTAQNKTVIVNADTKINVQGGDAAATGRAVAKEQTRVNGDLARNMAGASN